MKIRIYNNHGKVKVTKVCSGNAERTMFHEVKNGEMVEVDIQAAVTSESHKYAIGEEKEKPGKEERHDGERFQGCISSYCQDS